MSFPTKLGMPIHLVILLRSPELRVLHLGQGQGRNWLKNSKFWMVTKSFPIYFVICSPLCSQISLEMVPLHIPPPLSLSVSLFNILIWPLMTLRGQIKNGRQSAWSNVQTRLTFEPNSPEKRLRCHFQLTWGCQFILVILLRSQELRA